jgi:micrococcal nuclease
VRARACLLAAALAAGGCGAGGTAASQAGRVAGVPDGDTIRLEDGRRIRLVQIDAPEREGECFGARAAAILAALLPAGTPIELERDPALDDVDRFGRLLRYVLRDGTSVNLELVDRGAAAPYFYRGERGRQAGALLAAARRARDARRGLWGACPATRLAPARAVDAR